jgi:hypothetical protein
MVKKNQKNACFNEKKHIFAPKIEKIAFFKAIN